MDQAAANALIAAGAAQIQQGLHWYEANLPSAEVTAIHDILSKAAAQGEPVAGVSAGTFANPDGGTNKPPS